MGGCGVDGAIHRAAGPDLAKWIKDNIPEIKENVRCGVGQCVITSSFNLHLTDYIIHTVGPVWEGGNNCEESKLAGCYFNSLMLAKEYNIKHIAFPAISTGIYGYPIEKASKIAVMMCDIFLRNTGYDMDILLVAFDESDREVLEKSFVWIDY